LPTEESVELLALTRELCRDELAPKAAAYEAEGRFPREVFRTLGKAGLLGLPYDEKYGGGEQPYEVYLQVVEELAAVWGTVAEGVSVHTLSCFPVAKYGTDEQRDRWLPDMVGGELLGAYCLSEPQSGSDAAALTTRAVLRDGGYVVDGTKAWITHGGEADFYNLMVRTSDEGARGISCLLAPADTPGLAAATPERKMGFKGSTTAQIVLTGATVPADRLIGEEGQGFPIALAALDGGRLGIAVSPRARWTPRSPTPRSASSSAAPSSTSRACRSCSRTWRPASRRAAPSTSRRPGAATAGSRSASRPPWPSCSARTWRCG
jgi:alkylation response protein AidB-like acyl-CoA dehydrogenase